MAARARPWVALKAGSRTGTPRPARAPAGAAPLPPGPPAARRAGGGQDRHLGGGEVEDEGQDELVGRVDRAGAVGGPLVAVAQRRLVAVMTVSDRDRPGLGELAGPGARTPLPPRAHGH